MLSLSIIRDVLIRVEPVHLDNALQAWNQLYGQQGESLAINGKTMCNAIDEQGYQTYIMSAVGHQTKTCYTPKKSLLSLYEQAMGLRTLPGYVDSKSVSSKPKVFAMSLRKCDSSLKMYGPSLTISECPKIQCFGHDTK